MVGWSPPPPLAVRRTCSEHAGRLVHCQEVGDELSVVRGDQEIARHRLLEGIGRTAHLPQHKEGMYRPSYPSHLPYQREAFLAVP